MSVHDELCFLPVSELSQKIRAKKLTSLALTDAYLARIEALAKSLNCFVTVTADRAREDAKRADAETAAGKWRGPLHGIPYGLKDLVDTKGIRTTLGAAPFAARVADADATVYRKLRDAGAVLLGKLSMIELAGGLGYHWADAAFNGPCLTPWDLSRWAGGSSSGAGSAVAAGLVGFAIGSETWGSIVCPSAFCGVTGLRPTYGLVSRAGAMALSWSFDKLGPLCRTAFDTALVLNVIAGRDPLDPGSVEAPRDSGAVGAAGASGTKLRRFVVPADQKYDRDSLDPIYDAAVEIFRAGSATVDALTMPALPLEPAAMAILTADVQAAFSNLLASGQAKTLADRSHREGRTMADSPDVSGALYVKAQQVRRMAQLAADELFAGCDAILSPNIYGPAPLVEKNIDEQLPWNDPLGAWGALAGLPAIAFPVGFLGANPASGAKGLPVSMVLVGKPFSEAKLVSLAAYFQQRTRFHLERPPHA